MRMSLAVTTSSQIVLEKDFQEGPHELAGCMQHGPQIHLLEIRPNVSGAEAQTIREQVGGSAVPAPARGPMRSQTSAPSLGRCRASYRWV
ncbi:hypothetical protein FRC12_018389 [Ceratobasidium sp. 428]|nr:hypothetical protein FRC12_018389 [Ceratobasidium sp. 428]